MDALDLTRVRSEITSLLILMLSETFQHFEFFQLGSWGFNVTYRDQLKNGL